MISFKSFCLAVLATALLAIVLGCSSSTKPEPQPELPPGFVWHVPDSLATISEAAALAGVNDTILVACGTYVEHDIVLQSGTVLMGASAQGGCVTIDANDNGRCLRIQSGPHNTYIEGISFINGRVSSSMGEFPDNVGGAIYGDGSGALQVSNCAFVDCSGTKGGGLYWGGQYDVGQEAQLLRLDQCEFTRCGGGSVRVMNSSVNMVDCSFVDGSATDGAGLYMYDRAAGGSMLTRCVFRNNTGVYEGGGAHIVSGNIVFDECRWEENEGGLMVVGGGGCGLWLYGSGVFTDCVFSSNSGYGKGGGVVVHGTGYFANCVFANNFIGRTNSNLPAEGGAVWCNGQLTMSNYTLTKNGALSGLGAGIYLSATQSPGTGQATIENTVIVESAPGTSVYCAEDFTITIACSDIWGNVGGDWVGRIAALSGMAGNFSSDPLLDESTWMPGAGSPCLPAGNSCGVLLGPDWD